MSTNKTIRLLFPQWQGGNNPNYAFGAELLAQIIPSSDKDELFTVDVPRNFDQELSLENGVEGEGILLKQLAEAKSILDTEAPTKVIVIGGDCAVSQAPFDYLNGKYDNLGILWLDAHPDVSDLSGAKRDHELVLANLLGKGAPHFARQVENKIKPEQVMFGGLIYDELREKDQLVDKLKLRYATPSDLKQGSKKILDWIKEEGIEYLAVHFDLDVLSPDDYRSIYPAEPYLESYSAAIGEMTLKQILHVLTDCSELAEIVGLSITEHLPWDAFNLRNALSKLSIFE